MQGLHHLLDGYPSFLSQETETAHPRTPIPLFYIHSLRHPWCKKPLCQCQRQRHEAARLLGIVAEGDLLLADAALLMDERAVVRSSATGTPQTTRIHIVVIPGVPEDCQLYGHSWQITEHRDVQKCTLCHIRGYCPGCTPIAPAGAQPFTCTRHAERQAQ